MAFPDSCRHIQLRTRSSLLGRKAKSPMHPLPSIFHLERILYHRSRPRGSTHACLLYLPDSAISVTTNIH